MNDLSAIYQICGAEHVVLNGHNGGVKSSCVTAPAGLGSAD